jgi:hypothetical protein
MCPNTYFRLRLTILIRILENVYFLTLRHNHPSWSYLIDNPSLISVSRMYGLAGLSWPKQFRLVNRWFFDHPRPILSNAVSKALSNFPTTTALPKRIGVQIRTGSQEWGEAETHGQANSQCFAQQAVDMCKRLLPSAPTQCGFYLTSDSDKAKSVFIAELKKKLPNAFVLVLNATTLHIDRYKGPKPASLDEERKMWLPHYVEWNILFHMDALVISRSGFSESAAWTTNVPTVALYRDKGLCNFRYYDMEKEPLIWW